MTLTKYSYSESASTLRAVMYAVIGYSWTHETERPIRVTSLKESELTNFCMQISEKSLAKVWDNEDDEYWVSYLKD